MKSYIKHIVTETLLAEAEVFDLFVDNYAIEFVCLIV